MWLLTISIEFWLKVLAMLQILNYYPCTAVHAGIYVQVYW